jgi:hypothetical protein
MAVYGCHELLGGLSEPPALPSEGEHRQGPTWASVMSFMCWPRFRYGQGGHPLARGLVDCRLLRSTRHQPGQAFFPEPCKPVFTWALDLLPRAGKRKQHRWP